MRRNLLFITVSLAIIALLGFQFAPGGKSKSELFTIYLVRHAEKDVGANPGDPPLTACGEQRAELLSSFFNDVPLEAVYSTPYSRTQQTASPTAKAKGLIIQDYSGNDLERFAQILIDAKQDALVVGHSNTTGVLAGILAGEDIGAFDEAIYNRIYQVVISEKAGRLHVFHTSFSCGQE
ncbi:MAG: histidine phosphatase family protein [Flavobacteriales bacterium]|nr:histidine phosphatase family protein [Flavobacteriales bacterium]